MTHAPSRHLQSGECLGTESIALAVGMVLLLWGAGPSPTVAQTSEVDETDLIEHYQAARQRLLVRRHLQREGQIRVLPPAQLPLPADSLRPSEPNSQAESTKHAFPIHDTRVVRRSGRKEFRKRFADVHWSFLGSTPRHTFLDTTRTQDLRARLQAQFGDPTQTLGDAAREGDRTERAQFEYWFVVNDSIPVQVTDTRGPRGRGVIVMAARRYRDQLHSLRDALLAPLRRSKRTPYVDYHYDTRCGCWYRTGFDGRTFFLRRTTSAAVGSDRRARLDTTNVPPSHSSPPANGNSP